MKHGNCLTALGQGVATDTGKEVPMTTTERAYTSWTS